MRKVYSYTGLNEGAGTSQLNNLILHVKELEKGKQAKLRVSRRKEIIKFEGKEIK